MSPENRLQIAWSDLPALFPAFPAPDRWLPLLVRHLELVEAAAPRVRVTAVSPEAAIGRQYAESLELLSLALQVSDAARVADVGSGGGYPGLVIAAVLPGSEVHLVEPLGKRARLLAEIAAELRLQNVHVHPERAEVAGRGPLRDAATLVTARAVAPLNELLEYTAPLAAPAAAIVLPKGSGLDAELEASVHAMHELACEPIDAVPMRPVVSAQVRVVRIRKAAATPERYPRAAGRVAKRPLQNR